MSMDWEHMEAIVYSVAGRELKLIEVMGGVLGALVGLGKPWWSTYFDLC